MATPQKQLQGKLLDNQTLTFSSEELVRVMYVEDDRSYLGFMENRLREWGCSVDAVRFPIDSLSYLDKFDYQIFLCDFDFPDGHPDGFSFIKTYRSKLRNAEPVLLTAFSTAAEKAVQGEDRVLVIDKTDLNDLEDQVKIVYARVWEELATSKENFSKKYSSRFPLAEVELAEVQNELISRLSQSENRYAKEITYGGAVYSIADLIEEVKKAGESRIGMDLIIAMRQFIKIAEHEED